MKLRPATRDDIPTLEYWDTKQHVIDATGAEDDIDWEDELRKADGVHEWLIADLDGRSVGALQIIDPKTETTHYWGDVEANLRAIDIWIGEETDLGRGLGTQMMTLAIERCFAAPNVTAILIDPLTRNVRAHRFYERFGFRFVEQRFFDEDDCSVYRLERDDWFDRAR